MDKATIVEIVRFKTHEGVNAEEFKADMQSAESMGENLFNDPEMATFFNSTMEKIDPKTLTDEFFEIFSTTKAPTV